MTVASPSACSKRSTRWAMSRVRSFSSTPAHIAPESWPPWPGSSTTTGKGSALAGARVVGGRGGPGLDVPCHQTNDANISASPSQARAERAPRRSRDCRPSMFLHLIPDQVACFFFRQLTVTDRAGAFALQHRRFDGMGGELFLSMLRERVALGHTARVFLAQRHVPNAPRVQRCAERLLQARVDRVFACQKRFH